MYQGIKNRIKDQKNTPAGRALIKAFNKISGAVRGQKKENVAKTEFQRARKQVATERREDAEQAKEHSQENFGNQWGEGKVAEDKMASLESEAEEARLEESSIEVDSTDRIANTELNERKIDDLEGGLDDVSVLKDKQQRDVLLGAAGSSLGGGAEAEIRAGEKDFDLGSGITTKEANEADALVGQLKHMDKSDPEEVGAATEEISSKSEAVIQEVKKTPLAVPTPEEIKKAEEE